MKKTVFMLFLVLLTALGLSACGKDETADLIGKYNCIAASQDGTNFTAPERGNAYVELKKGGKGEISDELAFDLTWKLDGESFSGTYKIFGIDAPITGTLKDNVLEINDDGVVIRYLKDGAEMPEWAKDLKSPVSGDGRLAGHYTLYAMDIADAHYDYAALVKMGEMDDGYLQIDYDEEKGYTGELYFDGEEPDTFTLDESTSSLTFSDNTQLAYYESEKGVIGVVFEELNSTIFYALESVDRGDAAAVEPTGTATDDPLLDWWNGDWYGHWYMYGCKGDYEDIETKYWDCEAHIDIDAVTRTGTMELWDDEMYQNMGGIGKVDVSLSDSGTGEHGTLMSEGGWFLETDLAHADWILDPGLSEAENMLVINGSYDDGKGNSYYYEMMLRPWGQLWEDVEEDDRPWSYEDWYKPMIEDGVTKMSVRFGDPDPSVYENSDGKNSESGTASAAGEVSLEKLKAGWETLHTSEDKYEMRYEDVRDLMGCDGQLLDIKSENPAYTWQNGNAILTVTFKVQEDGSKTCIAIAITGL